jgi:hypothetical protein
MNKNKATVYIISMIALLGFSYSCSTKKSVKFTNQKIAQGSSIAVIIDCPNKIKNVIMSRLMIKKFKVKAFNASDLYTLDEIYDIKDFKKASYKAPLRSGEKSLLSMEKTFDNIYKLHIYNFEINKLQTLAEMKEKWNVRYLILFDLKDWSDVCWGRAIDLNTYELIWVENYPTRYSDTPENIIDHFIDSMSGA